ncbi:MAG: hypothetical protein JO180_03815 [Gemmatirosa sp.]|nr:hypothetical protein [Gemmatirosa sp.]
MLPVLLLRAARVATVVAAVLTVMFDPRVFFGSGQGGGGWISFGGWFHGGAWTAMRVALVALGLFVAAAASGAPRVGWRGPAVAAVLVAWGLARGVPHRDNASTWWRGDVGVRAWIRAERARRARTPQTLGSIAGAAAFAGEWRASDGSTWRFGADAAERVAGPGAASPATRRAACGGIYRASYVERGREVFDERGVEDHPPAAAALRALPPNARVAVAEVACSVEPWAATLVRVGDEVWLLEPYTTTEELQAGAFVLRRGDH